jgi:hypothetical protein
MQTPTFERRHNRFRNLLVISPRRAVSLRVRVDIRKGRRVVDDLGDDVTFQGVLFILLKDTCRSFCGISIIRCTILEHFVLYHGWNLHERCCLLLAMSWLHSSSTRTNNDVKQLFQFQIILFTALSVCSLYLYFLHR